MTESRSGWERPKLRKYAFGLAVTFSLLVGVVLTLFDRKLTAGAVLSSIGLNLVASAAFAVFFSWLSGNIQERILLDGLRDEYRATADLMVGRVDGLSVELFGRLAGFESRYMPNATYEATEEPASAFNQDVNADLAATSSYAFRGTSAKFVSFRLETAQRRNLRQVKIIMLDPRSEKVLRVRAAERMEQRSPRNGSPGTIEDGMKDIKDEILMSLVALYEQRHVCPIDIALVREPAVTRLEVFDDAIYLSWYRGPKSTNRPFPETFRFLRGSFLYDVYAQEIYRRYDIADLRFELRRDTTEDQFRKFLEELAGGVINDLIVSELKDSYVKFVKSVEKPVSGI